MGESNHDVIVVGGGFAGVTAARDLTDAGASVLLLEARERLGGRTWYRKMDGSEELFEAGGAYVDPGQNRFLRRELDRYGVNVMSPPMPAHFLWLVGGKRVQSPFPVPIEEVYEFERAMYELIHASRLVGRAGSAAELTEYDVSLADFLAGLELPPATHDYLDTWGRMQHGCLSSEVSALQTLGWMVGLDYSALALALVAFHKIEGGTKKLLDAIAAGTAAEVKLGVPVRTITDHGDRVAVKVEGGTSFEASAVVCAIPLNCWADLECSPPLGPGKATIAAERHPGRCLKVAARVSGAPMPLMGAGQTSGFDLLATDRELGEEQIMIGMHMSGQLDAADPSAVEAAMRDYAPAAKVLAADAHDWSADPYAKGSWVAFRPGWLTEHGEELRAAHGRIVFASGDIAPTFPGWIDGAIESGSVAATALGPLLGRA